MKVSVNSFNIYRHKLKKHVHQLFSTRTLYNVLYAFVIQMIPCVLFAVKVISNEYNFICASVRYTTGHIWACPPSEGDDYIFHCHPVDQKIPKPKRLQEWYKKMLDKAVSERIVHDYKVRTFIGLLQMEYLLYSSLISVLVHY